VPPAPTPPGFQPRLPSEDAISEQVNGEPAGDAINGVTIIIGYRDAKGEASTRQVSCIRIENSKGKRYLRAFCHQRRALRTFLIERIDEVLDAETGEVINVGSIYFAAYADDRISETSLGWGLSPMQRAELGAALTVLTFLSRCDGRMHAAELAEIESFAASWWIRTEIRADYPEVDIIAHIRRLAPDPEAFFVAAERVWSNTVLASLVGGYTRRVIEADDQIAKEEAHWISRLAAWLETAD
jgi:hypothetical protein